MTRLLIAGLWAMSGLHMARAEDYPGKEVFGFAGAGKTYDDEGSLGSGFNGGGGFGYRLSSRIGMEAEVNGFRTRREFSSNIPAFQASGVHVTVNGLRYFSRGPVQPYVVAGAGLLHVSNSAGFGGPQTGASDNGLALNAGAGLKIFVNRRVSVRPDFRILTGNSGVAVEAPFTVFRLSIAVGYHW